MKVVFRDGHATFEALLRNVGARRLATETGNERPEIQA
jgi:hypothetical protein